MLFFVEERGLVVRVIIIAVRENIRIDVNNIINLVIRDSVGVDDGDLVVCKYIFIASGLVYIASVVRLETTDWRLKDEKMGEGVKGAEE